MLVYIIIIIAGIILDQLSKICAVNFLSGMTTYPIIPNVFHLTYVENTGAAFNIFTDMRMFLIIVTLIFIGILGYLFYLLPKTKPFSLANLGLSLMLSGAIGNLIDRIRLAYVIDFIEFRLINFAVFNVADSLVVVGAFMLLFAYLKNQALLPMTEQTAETEEYDSEVRHPIRKDVFKDFKPFRNSHQSDISPVVHTEIIELYSGPKDNFIQSEEPVENDSSVIYTSDDVFNRSPIINDPLEEEFVYHAKTSQGENRYTQLSDQYLESVQKQYETSKNHTKPLDRYFESIDRFEEQVTNLRNRHEEDEDIKIWNPDRRISAKKKSENLWEPKIEGKEAKVKTYETTWNPEITGRYGNEVKTYETTWNPEYKDLSERPKKEEPVWIPDPTHKDKYIIKDEDLKLKESSDQTEVIPTQIINDLSGTDKEPVKQIREILNDNNEKSNRYYQTMSHYLDSIEKVKNKKYTEDEQE